MTTEVLCNPETTHVVAQKMSRSEKMLGSIASGKWILHPSYIEACMAAKEILSNFKGNLQFLGWQTKKESTAVVIAYFKNTLLKVI